MQTVEKLLLSLTVAACGGGSPATPDGAIVVEPDAPIAVTPTPIVIDTTDLPPNFVAVRDGLTAAWTVLPAVGTSYTFDVHGPYLATVVCDNGGDVSIYQFARTPEDDTFLDAPCFDFGPSGPIEVARKVTGTVAAAGKVAAEFRSATSPTPNWQFELDLFDGSYDFVALSSDRVLLRRAVAISADTTVAPLDVAQGEALVATPLTVTNTAAGETLTAELGLFTQNTFISTLATTSPADAKVIPQTLLNASDRQRLAAVSSTGDSRRGLRRTRFKAGDPTTFALPDAITGGAFTVAAGQIAVHWATLPARDALTASLFAVTDDLVVQFHDLDIGAAFAATATQATFDTDIPGFLPAWRIDPAKDHSRTMTATKSAPGEFAFSQFSEDITAAR